MTPLVRADFFLSYAEPDATCARWIRGVLEGAGRVVRAQSSDMERPGTDFVAAMDQFGAEADRLLLVLSRQSSVPGRPFVEEEWAARIAVDPDSLIPVRIDDCSVPPIMRSVVHIDLHGLTEPQARARLLGALG